MLPDIEAAAVSESDPEESARIAEALAPTRTARWELGQQRALAYTVASQGKELVDMVEATEGMVLTTAAQAVSVFEAVKTEGNAFIEVIEGVLGQNQDPTEEQMLAVVDNFVNEQLQTGAITQEIAQAYREFHASAIRYVYNVGRALGQQGNGFSNKDFQFIYNSIITSNSAPAFINNLKRFAAQRFAEVQATQDQLLRSGDINVLLADPKIKPYVEHELMPLDQQYPELYEWMNAINEEQAVPAANGDITEGHKPGEQVTDSQGQTWVYVGGPWRDKNSFQPANNTAR
jgi:hypothetical protein